VGEPAFVRVAAHQRGRDQRRGSRRLDVGGERRIRRHMGTIAIALRYGADLTAEQADLIRAEVRA